MQSVPSGLLGVGKAGYPFSRSCNRDFDVEIDCLLSFFFSLFSGLYKDLQVYNIILGLVFDLI